ncbi:MAG: methylglyoxal synthase [Psychromonas sp.]|jgi:methylglyoxal synthase|uniref:methylglyoxal synthase n=1 Tax=Psychromonas sp. TaxID=1884585 RepID=UPI0039E38888
MKNIKRIALVAYGNREKYLIEWVEWNYKKLIGHQLISTGTTGNLVEKAINKNLGKTDKIKFKIKKLKSGPLGGDQQLGAMIAENKVDLLIFLWDPMQPQTADVQALLRIAVLYNIPTANNRSTADFLILSPIIDGEYKPEFKDYSSYRTRYVVC